MRPLILLTIAASLGLPSTLALTDYANEFFTPADVHSSWAGNATWAQSRIVEDAQWIAGQGPWGEYSPGLSSTISLNPWCFSGDVEDDSSAFQ